MGANIPDLATAAAQKYGIDPRLVLSVIQAESGGNPAAVSPAGAQGVMQLMPATARELGVADPMNPAQNVDGGVRYLKQQMDRYGGDPRLALAAYNGGMGRLDRVGRNIDAMPAETRAYVEKVMGGLGEGQPTLAGGPGGDRAPGGNAPDFGAMLAPLAQRLDAIKDPAQLTPEMRLELRQELRRLKEMRNQFAGQAQPVMRWKGGQQVPITDGGGMLMQRPDGSFYIDKPENKTELQRLQEYRDSLPEGDPRRQEVQDQIAKQTTQRPEGEGRDFTQAKGLRGEFITATKPFVTVQDAFNKIKVAAQNPSPAGDLSLLYGYMKMLDPESVVRESEFAAAAQAGSFGERIQGYVGKILTGERLPDSIRQDFLGQAANLYKVQRRGYDNTVKNYGRFAEAFGIPADNVIVPLAIDDDPMPSSPPIPPPYTPPQAAPQQPQPLPQAAPQPPTTQGAQPAQVTRRAAQPQPQAAQPQAPSGDNIPTFNNPSDPALQALPSGALFFGGGQLRRKP